VTAASAIFSSPNLASVMLFPALLLVAAMFFTSLYFTYRDSFEAPVDAR